MAELFAPWNFEELDDAPAANSEFPFADIFARLAVDLNHLCGRHWQILFNQHITDAMIPAHPAGNINPLYQIRFNDVWPQTRQLHTRVVPRKFSSTASPTLQPRIRGNDGVTTATFEGVAEGTAVESANVSYMTITESNVVGGVFQNLDIDSLDDLRPIAVAMVGRRWDGSDPIVLSSDVGPVIPTLFYAGKPITHTDLITMRDAIDRVWKDGRRNFAAWSAVGNLNTSANTIAVISLTDVNLMDQAVTVRSATSPGCICPIQYCGRLNATQVEASVAVYAEGSGGTGTVTFESSQGAISIGSIVAKGWYAATASTLLLGGTIANEYDKVDIFGRVTAGTLRVWAWSIIEDPL